MRTAVYLLVSPDGLAEWLPNGFRPLLTPYNVCGVVGLDKQKSSEDLVSTCCAYSEAIIVRGQENYSFSSKGLMKMYVGEGRHG